MKIISLVPSLTETLHYLGLDEEVIGITKFCVHPHSWFRTKERVGGTKDPKVDRIRQLSPDLILASREENRREDLEPLMEQFPVLLTDIKTLEDALAAIRDIGERTGKSVRAGELAQEISSLFDGLPNPPGPATRVAYLIWKDPYMTVGADTFISDMIRRCGWTNVFGDGLRYPEVSIDHLQALGTQHLLLSSEPYPFRQPHLDELSALLPGVSVHLVDGEYFSWYGSRLLGAPSYFGQLAGRIRAAGVF